jgi:hypothetical protein
MSQQSGNTARPDRKKRLSIYLDPDLSHRLADHAGRHVRSRSMIAEAAIASRSLGPAPRPTSPNSRDLRCISCRQR